MTITHVTSIAEKASPGVYAGGKAFSWWRWECSCGRRGTWRLKQADADGGARIHRLSESVEA